MVQLRLAVVNDLFDAYFFHIPDRTDILFGEDEGNGNATWHSRSCTFYF